MPVSTKTSQNGSEELVIDRQRFDKFVDEAGRLRQTCYQLANDPVIGAASVRISLEYIAEKIDQLPRSLIAR